MTRSHYLKVEVNNVGTISAHVSVPGSIVAHPQKTLTVQIIARLHYNAAFHYDHRFLVRIHTIQQRQLIYTKRFISREPSPLLPLSIYQLKTLIGKDGSAYFNRKIAH